MATYYIDPDSGNDANAGTSFALAWKTITSGATAARIAPGDTIRIKASQTPTSLGSCTWSRLNNYIQLPSTVTQSIDTCDSTWTAVSANVTQATDTSTHREGSAAINFTIALAFTTGKVAYKTLSSTLDLSGYQQVCFWYKSSDASHPAGRFQLRLCSDTTGDVAVNTLSFPLYGAANLWQCVVIDNAANLGSNINSISLWATTDPGATNVYLDHIFASKDKTSVDSLTLRSVIGKFDGTSYGWYTVRSINGTFVYFEDNAAGSTNKPYVETSETVTTYKFEPYVTARGLTGTGTIHIINDSGSNPTSSGRITFSGGWNPTDMSTQTGMSWWDLQNQNTTSRFIDLAGKSYITFERIGASRCGNFIFDNNTAGNDFIEVNECMASPCNSRWYSGYRIANFIANKSGYHSGDGALLSSNDGIQANLRKFKCTGNGNLVFQAASGSQTQINAELLEHTVTNVGNVSWFTSSDSLISSPPSYFYNCVLRNISYFALINNGYMYFINPETNGLTALASSYGTYPFDGGVFVTNLNQSSTDHRQHRYYCTVVTDTSTRHSSQGFSWKITPLTTSMWNSDRPFRFRLPAQLYKANVRATVTAWLYKTTSNIVAQLVMPAGGVAGVTTDVTDTLSALSTWTQLKIQFTPTQTVVAAPEVWTYSTSGTTNSVWVDDVQFS